MADLHYHFLIHASIEKVFEAVVTAKGLESWWTKKSSGEPALDSEYEFWFAPEYDWRGLVRKFETNKTIEWEMTSTMDDWLQTVIRVEFEESGESTQVKFSHLNWKEKNNHYRITSYCWAMYLRLLKRYVEHGEVVPYEQRLEV